jgi:hypothetical protein
MICKYLQCAAFSIHHCLLLLLYVNLFLFHKFDELKIQLQAFRDVVIAQCPEFIDLIPTVDGIEFDKFENNSVVMTDTCNGARKTNILIKTEICKQTGKTIHLLLCYNHLRNVWIKNVLKESTAFLREYLLTSLEEIAPVLRVSPCMSGIARAFDREFSLCANYPKGHGQLFQQWMKRNHLGELLLHVERAESGGRQDVVPMASLAIYWNRNYCIEFLDYMLGITRPNKEDSILVQNPYVILSSLEMVAAARMWGIIHIAILMPIRWLSGNIHELDVNNWCYFHLGMVLDRLKEKLDDIVEHPELIHDEEFMMSIIWHWKKDLPSFNKYYKYQFEEKRMDYVVTPEASGTKAVPLYEVRKELFDPDDDDNIACTEFLEEISAIAAETWIAELLNPKKGTYQFMSDSNSAYCYKNVTEELKRAAMGKLAVNDLAESSFAGLTAQLKSFGRADLKSLAAVSDLAFNGFMDRPLTSDEIKNDQRGFFHTWPEELKLALASSAMEIKSATKKSNNIALERLHRAKQQKEEVMRLAGITKATEEYIQCLIYHTMSKSDRCWKTAADVKKGLASIQYVKDQELALKDNIQMRYLGMGFNDCHTTWTKDRKKKSIDTLAKRLIEIIKLTRVRPTPDRLVPKHCGEKRKEMPRMGHITAAVVYIHEKRAERINEFDLSCRQIWKERDTTMVARMQKPGAVSINDAHVGKRIEILSEFGEENDDYDPDAEDIAPKTSMWCQGTIVVVDEENESAWVEWDAIPSVGYPAS